MKNITQKLSILILLATLFTACDKNNGGEDVTPETLVGKWFVKHLTSNVALAGEAPEIKDDDVSDQNLYFEFAADSTYTTNGELSLGKFEVTDNLITTGAYSYENGVVALEYTEATLGVPITLYMTTEIVGNKMTMNVNRDDLVKAFGEITNLSARYQVLLPIIIQSIITFEFGLSLEK